MKVYVNGLWHDSDIEPIVIAFSSNKQAKQIGEIISNMPDPNKYFVAFPNDMPISAIETIKNFIIEHESNISS